MSDYERAVIDSCLANKRNIPLIVGELQPEDFESAVCSKAFTAINNLFDNSKPITQVTLCDNDSSIPADLFGESYIEGENLEYYISKVKEQGKRKRLKRAIAQCSNIVESQEIETDEAIHLIQDTILGNLNTYKEKDKDIEEIADTILKQYKERKKKRLAGEDIIALPTGIDKLDNVIGGLQPSTLTVIGGRQGHGKSTLAMDFFHKLTFEGHPSLYISLEQAAAEIFLYLIQKYTTYSPLNIKLGDLKSEEEHILKQAVDKLKKRPIFINDQSRKLSDLITTIRTHHITDGIEVVVIDYLQLIENPHKKEPRHIEVAGISRSLKQLTMNLNISIIALSQLNKEPEGRPSKKIYLSDTRESEAITQDADYVIFLNRPSIYGDDEKDYISLAKNRYGTTVNKIHLNYDSKYNTYREV
ncbi:MAG: AAA family ATPase [Deltaproteobacteria bacterium]|nr:AAA family ATPase [Deltaproteobacteria bacterium]